MTKWTNSGKKVGGTIYVHIAAYFSFPDDVRESVHSACEIAKEKLDQPWNVLKLELDHDKLSLLYYPSFLEDPFPALKEVCTVDLHAKRSKKRSYRNSPNPPILHRKELLLPANDPHRSRFASLTAELKEHGMFRDSHQIGFRQQWMDRLREAGLQIKDHHVVLVSGKQGSRDRQPW